MAEVVYLLCGAMSMLCAVLLFRGFRQSQARLLLWAAWCFVGLTANNLLLFVDLIVVPAVDLSWLRTGTALVSLLVLVGGLVWDSR